MLGELGACLVAHCRREVSGLVLHRDQWSLTRVRLWYAVAEIGEMRIRLSLVVLLVIVMILAGGAGAHAAPSVAPTRFVVSTHIGAQVNRTTGGNICTAASGDECRSRTPSKQAGGFDYPGSVATDPRTGDLYVADLDNYRVQKFTAAGLFVAMFGWGVDETKDRQVHATQAERNVCTAISGDLCTTGASGSAAGQLTYPVSVTVDPVSGDVYVAEINTGEDRVEKYTAGGRFVWMVGKDVNETTKGNLCSEREIEGSGVICKAGVENATDSIAPSAFRLQAQYGDLLAAGGPEDLLYVGDEHRVQEFDAGGRWKREILLASISSERTSLVAALAVDGVGDVYLVYSVPGLEEGPHVERAGIVREFNPKGEQVGLFRVDPRLANATVHIDGIALDPAGTIAVIGVEFGSTFHTRFGSLYEGHTGRLIGVFPPPSDNDGLTLSSEGDLYVAATDDHEVVAYVPAPATELVAAPVPCQIGVTGEPGTAFNCALNQQITSR